MNIRAWVGSFFWIFGFNLLVAWIAIYSGIGWAIAILSFRHTIIGIPRLYNSWRKFVVGSTNASKMPELAVKEWPNRKWLIETSICFCISVAFIIWFNYPLGELLFKK